MYNYLGDHILGVGYQLYYSMSTDCHNSTNLLQVSSQLGVRIT